MTDSRDPDRIVRAWLDLMPSEAPDRAIDAVLQAVATAPQVRLPVRAPFRRPFQMTRFSYAAIAAVVVVILAGAALGLGRFNGPPAGASPSPTIGVTSAPSAAAGGDLPVALQGTWFGGYHAIAGLPDSSGTALHIGPRAIALTGSADENRKLLAVDASSSGSTVTISTASAPTDGCQPGQTGTYTYAVSASGQTLTIGGEDGCPQRAHLFAGPWWLADCHTQDAEPCLGLLDAGDYGSQYFASIGAHGIPWRETFGALTFTVPAGWASDADWPSLFSLAPAADYAATPLHGTPSEDIAVYSNVMPESQATPCSGQPILGELSAADYLAWLRTVPGLSVSATSHVTIGGRQAIAVDLTVPEKPTATCDGTDHLIEYLLTAGWYATGSGSTGTQTHALGAGQHDRLILVEMPSGYLTAVVITTNDGTAFDAFAQEAMPIVASFQFRDAFPTP